MAGFTQNVNTFTDYGAEAQDIERRRKMAELLQQQALQPIEQTTAGGYVTPISWTQGLAKALQGYAGMKGQEAATQEQKDLAGRAKEENINWLKSLQGTPATAGLPASSFTPEAPDYQDNPNLAVNQSGKVDVPAQPGMPAQPLNDAEYRSKLLEGASSGNPMTSGIAGPMLAKMLEPEKFGHTTEQRMINGVLHDVIRGDKGTTKDLGPTQLAPKLGGFAAGTTIIDENNPTGIGQPSVGTMPKPIGGIQPVATIPRNDIKTIPENWAQQLPAGISRLPTDPPGVVRLQGADKSPDLYQAEFENGKYVGLKKLDNSTKVSLSANMPPQEKAFESELGKGQAEELIKGRKAADDAVSVINTVNEGRKIMKSGMITGFGADAIVSVGQALKQAGIDFGGDAAANTQAYTANMAQNVGKIIKQFGSGTGLSDADRKYAEQMAGGKVNLDPVAINRILDINEKQARWVIEQHNKRASGVKSNIPLTVEMPSSEGASAAAASSAAPRVRKWNPVTQRVE